jgi:hypothetical protein
MPLDANITKVRELSARNGWAWNTCTSPVFCLQRDSKGGYRHGGPEQLNYHRAVIDIENVTRACSGSGNITK